MLVEGNPQRVINGETVGRGGAAVKEWLAKRLAPGYARPAHPFESDAAEDPPPPPPAPPPPKAAREYASEIAALEADLRTATRDLDAGEVTAAAATAAAAAATAPTATAAGTLWIFQRVNQGAYDKALLAACSPVPAKHDDSRKGCEEKGHRQDQERHCKTQGRATR